MKKLVVAIGVLVVCSQAMAAVVYSDSFESYAVGSKAGGAFDNWYSSGNIVTNADAKTGTHSVALNKSDWATLGRDSDAFYATGSFEYSFKVGPSGTSDYQVYLSNGEGENYAELNLNYWSGINYKQSNGAYVLLQAGSNGAWINNWNTLRIDYDAVAKKNNVFFNGVQIGTNLGMRGATITGTGNFVRAYLQSWATDANYPTLIDDWSLSAVPEPATMSLLALGGLALLRRKNS